VALANLDLFDKEHLLESLPPKIDRLRQHLERIGQLEHVGHVRQCGLIAGIELVRDRAAKEPYPRSERRGWRVCLQARTEGVLLRPLGDVVVIFPPLAISLEELDFLCEVIERSIAVVCP
jgi:adenosylmethionine-8-amino-7-oxononanoate aminotransferase